MKLFLAVVLLLLTAAALFAQPASRLQAGISIGGATTVGSSRSGGFAELGIPLFVGRALTVRSYMKVGGYAATDAGGGIVSAGEELTIGGSWRAGFETYAFFEGNFGLFDTAGKSLTAAPYLWGISGGGGLQIDLSPHFAYFAQMGGGWNAPTSDPGRYAATPFNIGFATISMGFRQFF